MVSRKWALSYTSCYKFQDAVFACIIAKYGAPLVQFPQFGSFAPGSYARQANQVKISVKTVQFITMHLDLLSCLCGRIITFDSACSYCLYENIISCSWKRKQPSLMIEHTLRPYVARKEQNLPSALLDLIKELSDDGLYIPESSITLRSIVGKGKVKISCMIVATTVLLVSQKRRVWNCLQSSITRSERICGRLCCS